MQIVCDDIEQEYQSDNEVFPWSKDLIEIPDGQIERKNYKLIG